MASEALRLIKEHFGNQTFRVRDAADAGIPRHILYEVPNITALPIIGATRTTSNGLIPRPRLPLPKPPGPPRGDSLQVRFRDASARHG